MSAARHRVIVLTADRIAAAMAGPAIRAVALAEVLAGDGHDVIVASTLAAELEHPLVRAGAAAPSEVVRPGDIVVAQGRLLYDHRVLVDHDGPVVVDLYDPYQYEGLAGHRHRPLVERIDQNAEARDTLWAQALRGDVFLCASERQRDLWIGFLDALGRVNPLTWDDDPTLRRLIDVVPFGVSQHPPRPRGGGLRGKVPGIGPDDRVALWFGGLYDWFDPLTVVEAVDRLRTRLPDLRLVFPGAAHPNPTVPLPEAELACRALADEKGLTGRHVIWAGTWVPYGERGTVLGDADVGISCHHDAVETAFSERTRVLDYLWAGLPVITTAGDTVGQLVTAAGAGLAVSPGDVDGWVHALERLLGDDAADRRRGAAAAAAELGRARSWPAVCEPLRVAVAEARRAPDLVNPQTARWLDHRRPGSGWGARLRREVEIARRHRRAGGAPEVLRRALGRLGRIAGRHRPG